MGTDVINTNRKGKLPVINEKIRLAFHRDLSAWYHLNARDLPWRRTRDPYSITVSEFMLQQTQVVTVIPYYHRWIQKFPTWKELADCSEEQVLKAWEGLGYYSRARNLHKLSRQVVDLGGHLPQSPEELVKLAGIGPYTAGAVASLAHGRRAPLVDGNVMRVFARVFNWSANITDRATQQAMWVIAEKLLPEAAACAVHNSALMELGAILCTPTRPLCLHCPLQKICQAKDPELLPVRSRQRIEERAEKLAMITDGRRWWLIPGPSRGRLAGFWRFPDFDPSSMDLGEKMAEFTYGITKYRVRLTAYAATFRNGDSKAASKSGRSQPGRWFSPEDLDSIPLSSAQGRLRVLTRKGS